MPPFGKTNEVSNTQKNAGDNKEPKGQAKTPVSSNPETKGRPNSEGLPGTDEAGFTPVIFICEQYPSLGFRGLDGKRTKFTNKRFEARSPEELAHMRKLLTTGGLSQHGVREIDRGNAERIAKEYMDKMMNQGRAMKGGMHSSAANLMNRDTELNQTVGPANAAKLRDELAKDGLIVTETLAAGISDSASNQTE